MRTHADLMVGLADMIERGAGLNHQAAIDLRAAADTLAAVAPTAAEREAAEWWAHNGGGTITDNTFSRQLLPEPRQHLRALVGFVGRVRALVEGESP